MKTTTFLPHTVLKKYGLATFFQIAFISLILIAIELIIILLEQRDWTPRSLTLPAVLLILFIGYRLSYRVVLRNGILLRLPCFRRYRVEEMIGITFGAQMGVGLVLYNVKCFFADGSHLLLSVQNPERLATELKAIHPELICADLQSK